MFLDEVFQGLHRGATFNRRTRQIQQDDRLFGKMSPPLPIAQTCPINLVHLNLQAMYI